MPNILGNSYSWFGGSVDSNGNYTLEVHGSYSTGMNQTLLWNDSRTPPEPFEIKARVVCNITYFENYSSDSLYFFIYSHHIQGLVYLESILEAGTAPYNDHTFDVDVTADDVSQGIVIGVTASPNYKWGVPPGPYGYAQIGQVQIIPVADPVVPSEPVEQPMITAKVNVLVTRMLPWWMCLPKKPVTPCPVRPAGFVPLSEYDSEFKFPLSSSRKPSRIKRDEDCIACRPVVGDENAAPAPTPEPVRPSAYLSIGLYCDFSSFYFIDWDDGPWFSIEDSNVPILKPDWFKSREPFTLEAEGEKGWVNTYQADGSSIKQFTVVGSTAGPECCDDITETIYLRQGENSAILKNPYWGCG